jgi:hypothetical protein
LSKSSNIYERIEQLCVAKNLRGVQDLAKKLGYDSAEKFYRLGRLENANPSVDMLIDLSNMFVDLNLRWLILGKGEMLLVDESYRFTEKRKEDLEEPTSPYTNTRISQLELQNKTLLEAIEKIGYGMERARQEELKKEEERLAIVRKVAEQADKEYLAKLTELEKKSRT